VADANQRATVGSGRRRDVSSSVGRSFAVEAEGRSIVGERAVRRGRIGRGCRLSHAGFGFAEGKNLVCRMRRRRELGRVGRWNRASASCFGIGVLLVGWR
jgi:hypothetical protein